MIGVALFAADLVIEGTQAGHLCSSTVVIASNQGRGVF